MFPVTQCYFRIWTQIVPLRVETPPTFDQSDVKTKNCKKKDEWTKRKIDKKQTDKKRQRES